MAIKNQDEEYFCGCCGRPATETQVWCDDCETHVSHSGPLPYRTFHAQHKRACPFQVPENDLTKIDGVSALAFAGMLANGKAPTLGNYRDLAVSIFGECSAAVNFLDYKIDAFGADELILADERQAVELLENVNLLTVRP
jgi:hypothetical protein